MSLAGSPKATDDAVATGSGRAMASDDTKDGATLARAVTWLRRPLRAAQAVDWQSGSLAAGARALRAVDRRSTSRPFEPFDALEQQVVEALLSSICRVEGDDLPAVDAPALVTVIETYVLGMPIVQGTNLRNLLVHWEYQPLVFGPRRARFTQLTPEERDANLSDWATAPQPARAAAFRGLKTLCMLAYWSQPSTWGGIGYDGPQAGLPSGGA